jgi:hypothetical protein
MNDFTVEEINLIRVFDNSNRRKLILEIKSVPLDKVDTEIQELMYRVVCKLEKMTNEEFSQCDFALAELTDERSE